MEDLAELKAKAYDLIRVLESTRTELQRVNNSIAKIEQQEQKEEKQPEGKKG